MVKQTDCLCVLLGMKGFPFGKTLQRFGNNNRCYLGAFRLERHCYWWFYVN